MNKILYWFQLSNLVIVIVIAQKTKYIPEYEKIFRQVIAQMWPVINITHRHIISDKIQTIYNPCVYLSSRTAHAAR